MEAYFKSNNYLYTTGTGHTVRQYWTGLLAQTPIADEGFQWISAAAPAANTTKQLYVFR